MENLRKNKNYRQQKGVTLIILVITIVVILILSSVTINTIFSENGVLNNTKDAQNKVNENIEKSTNKTNELIDIVENEIKENSTIWTQNKTEVTDGITTYEVGDDYEYDCGVSGYTGAWKILGAEDGKLLIMSTADIGTLQLSGKEGYNTGISKLNEMCKPYGTNARSIKVEDINRVTGYDPNNTGDGKKYGEGQWDEYGNKVTYTLSGSTATNGKKYEGTLYNNKYENPDGKIIGTNGVTSVTETSTYYYYYPYSLTTSNDITGECKGIPTTSKAYELIFGTYANTSTGKGNIYWIASQCVFVTSNYSYFTLRHVNINGRVSPCNLCSSGGKIDSPSIGVRAVVSIQ